MDMKTKLLLHIFDCGIIELDILLKRIKILEDETEYKIDDILIEIGNIYGNYEIDYNRFMFALLYLYSEAIKDKLASFFDDEDIKDFIYQLEPNIYVNYADSGYESEFNNWRIIDIDTKDDAIKFLEKYKNYNNNVYCYSN